MIAILALATACSPRTGLERLALGDDVMRTADIAYGDAVRQSLDIYRPFPPRSPAPVVLFLYGGRWKYGSKDDYLLVGNAFVRRGWVTVIADYRLHPEALFPAWVEDGASAVRWTLNNIEHYGGDATRITVVGHSAGAHTVALLALDERYLREAGVPAGSVQGFVSIAGPVDTTWTAPDVQRLMGPPGGWSATYPSTHIDGREPPLLLLHGDRDEVVSPANSVRLAGRIRQRGGCVNLVMYRGVGHVDIAIGLGLPAAVTASVLDDLARFVRDPVAATCPRDHP